jgi:hypothetical protein
MNGVGQKNEHSITFTQQRLAGTLQAASYALRRHNATENISRARQDYLQALWKQSQPRRSGYKTLSAELPWRAGVKALSIRKHAGQVMTLHCGQLVVLNAEAGSALVPGFLVHGKVA